MPSKHGLLSKAEEWHHTYLLENPGSSRVELYRAYCLDTAKTPKPAGYKLSTAVESLIKADLAQKRGNCYYAKPLPTEPAIDRSKFVRMLNVGTEVTFQNHLILGKSDIGRVEMWHRDVVQVRLISGDWSKICHQCVEVIPEQLEEV